MKQFQEVLGLDVIPHFAQHIRGTSDTEGVQYWWQVDSSRFTKVAEFLIGLPTGKTPCDMNVMHVRTTELIVEIDESSPDLANQILHYAANLPTATILSVNFAEPPVSVHLFETEAVNLTRSEDSEHGIDAANLSVAFTTENPPDWLMAQVTAQA